MACPVPPSLFTHTGAMEGLDAGGAIQFRLGIAAAPTAPIDEGRCDLH